MPAAVLRGPALGTIDLDRRPPSPRLSDIVEHHWTVRWSVPPGEEREARVVTHPCVHLTVQGGAPEGGTAERGAGGGKATVQGVVTRTFSRTLVGSGRVVGVHFRPAGFTALWPGPLSQLVDRAVPAAELLGPDAAQELELEVAGVTAGDPEVGVAEAFRRMEAFLERWRRPRPDGAELVDRAVDHIVAHTDITRVEQVAHHFAVSARTLQRRFERYLGVGPKWVIQRRRIHEALETIEQGRDVNWSVVAARLGFADQAHFVHAFTDLVGRPPSAYERQDLGTPYR